MALTQFQTCNFYADIPRPLPQWPQLSEQQPPPPPPTPPPPTPTTALRSPESPSAATARSAPLEPQSPSKFPASGRAALSASGAHVPTRGLGVVGLWWRRQRAGGQLNAPAGARTSGAGRTVEVGGGGGGPGQLSQSSSPLRMAAAAGSRYHLGTAPGHALGIPEPRTLAPSGSTWELPRNRDGGVLVHATQDIPLQVDMSMALRRVRISDKYSKSYFSLLQAASVAKDEVLLCVKDVSHFLMQDIAFLSGKQTFSYIKIRQMFESISKVNLVLLIGGYIIFIFQ
ncbi:protein enabled homolog [Bos taurus]|uniref:protein enabled homolog n=1 Tax=Bos taurus TaxID=9913 RepID=UPI0028CB2EB7|nr:protein enabled homolog [Bos taurus]